METVNVADTNKDNLVRMMVGRDVGDMYSIEHFEPGETVLEVSGLTRKGVYEGISFEVRRGRFSACSGWSVQDAQKSCAACLARTRTIRAG